MFALNTAPVKTDAGFDRIACIPQPRIQRLRYGSPAPDGAPSSARGCRRSGQVATTAAVRYASSGHNQRRTSALLQVALEQLVGKLRIRLAAAPLHHFADERAKALGLARTVLLNGRGV